MGNGDEASGDGYRYRGRRLIQLTGKNNRICRDQTSTAPPPMTVRKVKVNAMLNKVSHAYIRREEEGVGVNFVICPD